MSESLFNHHVARCFFQNETPTRVLSCEFCEHFKSTIFTEHHRTTTASVFWNIFVISENLNLDSVAFPEKLSKRENFFSSDSVKFYNNCC